MNGLRADPGDASWRPAASLENLRRRAAMLAAIRRFFADRRVLEVETPVLVGAPASDPNICSLPLPYEGPGAPRSSRLWLQTSPEHAMKRLLAAGSGSIYQICRVFRADERGRWHNPEFSMLEWYRVGFGYRQLMDEVAALVSAVLDPRRVEILQYRDAFLRVAGLDPFRCSTADLGRCVRSHGVVPPPLTDDARDAWLDLLLSTVVGPRLGQRTFTFLCDFPASQAALARVRGAGATAVAERFELFIDGMEIANGYHELADAAEQRQRFEQERARRLAAGQPALEVDERLLAALAAGLPDCAGVALGLDRLVMLAVGADRIDEVMSFPIERC